jgi:hypothetical protein
MPHCYRSTSTQAITRVYGRRMLLFTALCLLTMPQSYRGGATIAHPHALFQFWFDDHHATADHHHDDVSVHDQEPSSDATIRSSSPDVPTITQVTYGSERADAIGGVLDPWFLPLRVAPAAIRGFSARRAGRRLRPEIPPPRLLLSFA